MQNIALPQKVEFKKGEDKNQGLVVIEPFYPGYGITLGNSLRRILLSSLPGAAVIGVKIKGASHEFMSLPHVKEDVLEIILNLKQLRLKVFSEETITLELSAHGEKTVKASDITKNSLVEIANPNLTLAHITDMAGSLNMEIFVSQGRGYETIESREDKKHEIGYIEMDSIFSPILSVGLNIENMRVGKMTNWDRLTLNILTDGTITVEDAFRQTVSILIDQFHALVEKEKEDDNKEKEIKNENKENIEEIKTEEEKQEKVKKRGRPKKVV
jgi:DNA-directed RNA polymerase subunit alpha